ncbi:hypothetical protein MTO96_046944, partial [Rhipicephalus appendiculatus]
LPLAVEVGFDQEVRRELEKRDHTVNVDNSKLRQYSAGHVNVLCRASQWWTKGGGEFGGSQDSICQWSRLVWSRDSIKWRCPRLLINHPRTHTRQPREIFWQ